MTYYVYGAEKSDTTRKVELLLVICRRDYKIFWLGEDYTIDQLRKLVPDTNFVPHIYHGAKYIGGIKELHDYLYSELKQEKQFQNETRE
jgi:hypothetical protein